MKLLGLIDHLLCVQFAVGHVYSLGKLIASVCNSLVYKRPSAQLWASFIIIDHIKSHHLDSS